MLEIGEISQNVVNFQQKHSEFCLCRPIVGGEIGENCTMNLRNM